MKITCIDMTTSLIYDDIQSKPIGASEFQFYNLITHISKYKNIICYNKISNDHKSGNILYKNINNIYDENFDKNDIIIIQRFLPEINMLRLFENNKIYITLHDYDFNAVIFQFQKIVNNNDRQNILEYIIKNNNINFVFNSEFTKKYYNVNFSLNNMSIAVSRQHIIYNVVYEDFFKRITNKKRKHIQQQ